ncbi:MAG: hypothetical protein IJ781_12475 [Atopobiaceae bacterium]|nr:hypothetical protein [Atopobiaceae bacterium]
MTEMLGELTVMNDVAKILATLNGDERRRVIVWLTDYFGILEDDLTEYDFDAMPFEAPTFEEYEVEEAPAEEAPDTFESFYATVAPKTAIQKIVTAAHWLETKDGKESWKSFEINKLLKSIDVKVTSVSGTLGLEEKKDQPLVEVLQKSGDSMQARKTFRLSEAGYAFVSNRLS